jgi:glycine dehydrogenase subunit 2
MTTRTRRYHAARWDEPIISDMGSPGQRGVLVDAADPAIQASVDALAGIPENMRRSSAPALPELSQVQVLRHYMRLSQMTLGFDLTPDASSGTCTMKYSPKVNELVARLPEITELHPLQADETMQGIMQIVYDFGQMMCAISGMDQYSLQPASGAQGIYTNACIIRAYFESLGEAEQRTEIITTAFSHPADAATPSVAGFKVITLMPGENGYPDMESLKAVLSDRTAGLMVTNPEDTGLFNPDLPDMVAAVQKAGGLCAYDQANANGLFGIVRAGDTGFDLCQFNLHKTFSAPHSSQGQGTAAVGVKSHLAKFLPKPTVDLKDGKYLWDHDRPDSIGKIRGFNGNVQTILKAYAWVMSLGADGLKAVAETAVINNNYLASQVVKIKGVDLPWDPTVRRLEQARYSWAKLYEDTGVSTSDLTRKMADYGLQTYMESHVPRLVDEPMTLEPTESLSLEELDEYVGVLQAISDEAYSDPETLKGAPYSAATDQLPPGQFDDPDKWAMTWRAFKRKRS